MNQPLIFAIPKGRIYDELKPLLDAVNIVPEAAFFDKEDRGLRFNTNNPNIDIIRVRSFDVATFVAFGAAQIGVVGSDVLEEFDYPDLYAPLDLRLGKCRLSVAEPAEFSAQDHPKNGSHIRVATKYPHLTAQHFAQRGIQAECIKLNGAMELAPAVGLAERIVDLVSSGATLKANGLVEIETIMEISSRLIVNRSAYKTRPDDVGALVKQFEAAL